MAGACDTDGDEGKIDGQAEGDNLEGLGIDGRIILQLMLVCGQD